MKVERIGFWRAAFIERLPRFYRDSGLLAFTMAGDCLRPWLLPGDIVLADSTLDPVDGELVLVNMKYRRSGALMIGAGVTYRTEPSIKQLVLIDGQAHACVRNRGRAGRRARHRRADCGRESARLAPGTDDCRRLSSGRRATSGWLSRRSSLHFPHQWGK